MPCGAPGGAEPATLIRCRGKSVTGGPVGRLVAGSSGVTSTLPLRSVTREATLAPLPDTSVTTTVPRTAVIALGVFTSIRSPGFMRSFATASAILPLEISMVATFGVSVIVNSERSRTVTTALPPSSMRARDCSPVAMRSRRYTSSLSLRGAAWDSVVRETVAWPSTLVTVPARDG